jgi:hypothetical protein
MNDQFGCDQNRQGDNKSGLHFNIAKEGKTTSRVAHDRKDGQRQPCDHGEYGYAAIQEFQPITGEPRPMKELEKWTAEYRRVIGQLGRVRFRFGLYSSRREFRPYGCHLLTFGSLDTERI